MKSLFITATNTEVGKTYTTLKLIEAIAKTGLKVGVFKPIETGVKDTPLDAKSLLDSVKKVNPSFKNLTPFDITAYTFSLPASPFCADINREIEIKNIIEKYKYLSSLSDILLIEGAGGLFVPIVKDYYMIDLIKEFNAFTLLVTPSNLGCINDTLLSIEALKSKNISFDWCVNLYRDKEEFKEVTEPFYNSYSKWWIVQNQIDDFVKDKLLFDKVE